MSIPPDDVLQQDVLQRSAPADVDDHSAVDHAQADRDGDGEAEPSNDAGPEGADETATGSSASEVLDTIVRAGERMVRWLRVNSFAPAWLPEPWRRPALGYLVAVLAQVVAVAITTFFDRMFPDFGSTDLLSALVIVLVALTFGAGPSLAATVVALPLIDFFLLSPLNAFSFVGPGTGIGLLMVLAVGITISLVASRVETQRRRAAQLAAEREAVLEAVPDGLQVFDEYRRLLRVNPAARRMLALGEDGEYAQESTPDRIARLRFRSLSGVPIASRDWPVSRVLRGETLKGPSGVDAIIEPEVGRELLINISGAPMRDGEGRLIGAALVLHDVSEQRHLERRTHEALSALLAMAEVLVASEEGEALDETYAAGPVAKRLAELTCRVLGCRRVAIMAVEPETERLHPVAVAGLSPELERRWWREQLAPLEQSGSQGLADWPDQSLAARLRTGEVLALDLSKPPYNEQPNPWSVRDVLIAPMRMGERIVGMLTLDHGGAAHAYTPDEMQLAGAVAKLVGLVVERERLFHQREEARARALALHNTNERMNEFLGVASHELKTPVTSLKVNVQLGARWLARLSRRATEVNERFVGDVERVRELLERSDRTMVRLTRLVDDLLDVSRIRAGRLELRREPSDLLSIVRDVVEEERAVVAEEGATARAISLELPDLPSVPATVDADRIGQVVTNFLTNALKYSPSGSPVEVRLEVNPTLPSPARGGFAGGQGLGGGGLSLAPPSLARPSMVAEGEPGAPLLTTPGRAAPPPVGEGRAGFARVSVRDSGPGLPVAEQEQIWEPFHRAEGVDVLSGSGVGLGLGLYISRTIIERHGGQVGVESTPGDGATFWFTLPLAPASD